MLLRLAKALELEIDQHTATAMFLTLVTDTGNFRYSNATPAAFTAAAELVGLGANPEQVSLWLYESQPLGAVRLLGELLQTLELHEEGRIATAALKPEMYERAGATRRDSEGLIDNIRSIDGVEIVALLRVLDADTLKASLRSRGETNIEAVAKKNGGGGHRNAAGCTLSGTLEQWRPKLVAQLAEQL